MAQLQRAWRAAQSGGCARPAPPRGAWRVPLSERMVRAWRKLWDAFVNDLYESHLVDAAESEELKACNTLGDTFVSLRSAEASRRLKFFTQSLSDPKVAALHLRTHRLHSTHHTQQHRLLDRCRRAPGLCVPRA